MEVRVEARILRATILQIMVPKKSLNLVHNQSIPVWNVLSIALNHPLVAQIFSICLAWVYTYQHPNFWTVSWAGVAFCIKTQTAIRKSNLLLLVHEQWAIQRTTLHVVHLVLAFLLYDQVHNKNVRLWSLIPNTSTKCSHT